MSNTAAQTNDYKYLDLLEKRHKKLDDKQRAVCCRTGNTIVAAGAGSGKTQVLATRFAWLVMSQNIRAPEILTLTFTKKAAGEMYERIYQTLLFFANDPETPSLEKKRAALALEEFSDTHIQTLDSYCNSIVKQAANRYGIRPDFSAGGGDSLEDIKKLALPFVLENKNRPCIQQYAQAGKLEDFAYSVLAEAVNKYTTLADEADFFVSKLEAQKELLLQSWNWLVCGITTPEYNTEITPLKILIPELQRLYKEASFVSPGTKFLLSCQPALDFLNQFDTNEITSLDDLKDKLEEIIKGLKLIGKISFPGGKQKTEVVILKDALKPLRESLSKSLISLCTYVQQFDETADLYKMFDEFSAIVNDSKRQTGNLTFTDISELALKILEEQEDLRVQEQNTYAKIMIDEFQDNNAKNKELLFLLNADEQKLFFVGDEKQSIYKFRGADVSVFNKLKTELGDDCFLQMNYNYRSNNNLLTTFNRIFGECDFIFNNKTQELYEAKYSAPAIKFDPVTQKELPPVSLTDIKDRFLSITRLDPDELDPSIHFGVKDQIAINIANTILSFKKHMEDNGINYPYSKFAILDRGRTDRRYLIKWLNVFNIPYTMDINTSLFSDGPINDIYNFIQLCVYPQDRISLAGYLASPFANLREQTIEAVLADADIQEITDETERQKYQAAMDFYKEQRLLTLSRPLTKTLELLWNECGYRYETMFSYRKSLYEEQFDMLFELARQTDLDNKGIAWFADQLSQIKNKEITSFGDDVEIKFDDLTYPIEKGDAVNIMTIHKSKGLQFGYVFVYGCTDVNKKNRDSQFFFDQKYGLTVKPGNGINNYFYLRQEEQAAKEELAEFRRLIYVAITRAEDYVDIIGSWKAEPTESWEKEDSLRLIEKLDFNYMGDEAKPFSPFKSQKIIPIERKEMKGMLYSTNSLEAEKEHVVAAEDLYKGEPAIKYEWPESNRKTPSSLEKDYLEKQGAGTQATPQDSDSGTRFDSPEDTLETPVFTAADFGTLVHAMLEAQAKGTPCDKYQPESKLLKNLNDSPNVLDQVLQDCRKMCQSFGTSDLGKQLDACKKAGRFYRAEWAFRMMLDGYIFTGSIDLIFENPDGTYTIVDYKSDKEINVELYRGQQECYKKAAARMLKVPEEKISCWLYFLRHEKALTLK